MQMRNYNNRNNKNNDLYGNSSSSNSGGFNSKARWEQFRNRAIDGIDQLNETDDLMKNGINVYFVKLKDEDPSDMGFKKVINLIKKSEEPSFSDLIRMRLNGKQRKYLEI